MKDPIKYDVNTLMTAVQDALLAEEEYRLFLRTWEKGRYLDHLTPKENRDYTRHDERQNAAWDTIRTICRLVNVDQDRLIPVVKAINRYERNKGKYDRCVHVDRGCYKSGDHYKAYDTEKAFRCAVAARDFDAGCYQSTGRKMQ